MTGQIIWWVPFLIVVLKGLWGLDAYQLFGGTFLAVNIAFGAGPHSPGDLGVSDIRRPHGALADYSATYAGTRGYNLNAATSFLGTLTEFEDEQHDS